MKLIDLTGQRFGMLTVLNRADNKGKRTMWNCLCDCGNKAVVGGSNLKNGNTRSCGCLHKKMLISNSKTHGLSCHPPYRVYSHMKGRCCNKNDENYKRYGGRGITICDEWLSSFSAFYEWSMKNGYKSGATLDRIDNNSGYSPSNCRWTTMQVQSNNRRSNHYITYNEKTMSASDWSRETGINVGTIIARDRSGKTPEEILNPYVRRSINGKYELIHC